ncbi:MAG: ATP-binding protein [Sedimenticola sp.]
MPGLFRNVAGSYSKRKLSWSLVLSVLLFGTLITLFATALQLYMDYQRDLQSLEEKVATIRMTHLGSLTTSLWKIDHQQIETELNDLVLLGDLVAVKIIEEGKEVYTAGRDVSSGEEVRAERFPMIYQSGRYHEHLGDLEITVSLSSVRENLVNSALARLGSEGLQIFLVSLFVLFITHYLIVRHLRDLGAYARALRIGRLDTEIRLKRSHGSSEHRDELDEVVDALNEMRENLRQDLREREEIEAELLRHQDELDQLVASRTEQLEKTASKLKASNDELQSFAYVISHDLQEPLRMVTSYMQLLDRRYKGKLDQDADDFINYAMDGAQRMAAMIEGLLQFSRVETQGQPFSKTDLQAVLQKALSNLRLVIDESGAEVVHDRQLPVLEADASQIERLFQNLVGNAIKFRGERPPRVTVSVEQGDGEWLFSVEDNGIGIPGDQAERIFTVFQRLHTREEYPGLGIGLAVCKRIVQRHGGRIWVENVDGGGSRFRFTLPAS